MSDTINQKTGHTPGPWKVKQVPLPKWPELTAFEIVAETGVICTIYLESNRPVHVCRENADVLAAAPDLIQALEEINTKVGGLFAAMGHDLEIGDQVWDEAFAALEKGRQVARKARGET